jgi:urease accessory protein
MTRISVALLFAITIAGAAVAHPGHAPDPATTQAAFMAGLAHPFAGLDHILAMVAVGLWAAQQGGKALWAWPLAFVAMMVAGGALGFAGITLPAIEPAIGASIVVLGLCVAIGVRLPVVAGAALIGAFAIFHGNAHGLEAPGSGAAAYAAGFAIATALLHGAGLFAGVAAARIGAAPAIRASGAISAAVGAVLVFA